MAGVGGGGPTNQVALRFVAPDVGQHLALRRGFHALGDYRQLAVGVAARFLGTDDGGVGVAHCRPGERPETALGRADHAMYQAKAAGRNRVEVWRSDEPGAA
ncbi:MAG: diguanylate cyclase [Aquabacterium sp.]|nr:MAG: diguanylate cyclase [Aquabacterium sp.]